MNTHKENNDPTPVLFPQIAITYQNMEEMSSSGEPGKTYGHDPEQSKFELLYFTASQKAPCVHCGGSIARFYPDPQDQETQTYYCIQCGNVSFKITPTP